MHSRKETKINQKKRLPRLVRWAVFSFVCALLMLPRGTALAHPVDMYAQEMFVTLSRDSLSIDWKLTPGPLLADSVWAAADRDQDGNVSQGEARIWLAPFVTGFSASLDGQSLDLRVESLHWPAAIDVLRTGEAAIQTQIRAEWSAQSNGAHHLRIHNAHLEGNSLGWFSVTTADGLSFAAPQQNNGQLDFEFGPSLALTRWNSGQPDLSGLLAGNPSTGPVTATTTLVGLVKTGEFSPLFLFGAFLLSLALGSLHALTPGHGKTLVAAYLIGSRGRSRDAIFLGFVVTLTHTGSVILLGSLTLLATQYILPGLIAPWLEFISGVLVVLFGVNLLYQRRQVLIDWWRQHSARPQTERKRFSLQSISIAQPVTGFGVLNIHSVDHHHGHGGHSHLPPGDVTWKSLLALGISGGLVPCPDAIAILLVAVAINRILFGMLLIVAFSLGLALVLILIGLALVQGARLAARNDWLNRFSRYTPIVSALVVSVLGLGLTVSAVHALRFTSAVGQGALAENNLLYLLPDADAKLQLMYQPLTGGVAISYTREPDGLAGYALSPDRSRIVYVMRDARGHTIFHLLNADGTGVRLLLDCQQAQCGAPVWAPDGQRLVYQRAEYVDETSLPRFSLWWLDVASGGTQPVFRDSSFASYAAAFSPDGKWLSYKSPSTNTLQLYNLKDGRAMSISVPPQEGALQRWHPASDALLFWDAAGMALHVTHYNLATGRKTDLGGAPDQVDYAAAWRPDGAWVAIERELPPAAKRKRGNQVWLVRPDGSDAYLLLGEDDISYSDLRWSADGRWLVYVRYSYQTLGKSEIWRVDVASGLTSRLVTGGMQPALLP